MAKDKLLITFEPLIVPKGRIRRWWVWNVYWRIWKIRRVKLLAAIYGGLADFLYWLAPESIKEEIDAEF